MISTRALNNKAMENSIKIAKRHLVFRDDAKAVLRAIQKKVLGATPKSASLDFSSVEFVSRSFADELLHIVHELKNKGVRVGFTHVKVPLRGFMDRVQKKKEQIRKEMAGFEKGA